ncbi:unnamed protein product, partial [Didymodactylos carnosus]
ITNNIIKPPTEHICTIDGTTVELRKFDEQIAYRALHTQETPDMIITNCYKGMSDPAIARLPLRDHIKRRIRMLRQNNNPITAANDSNFASVPIPLSKTVHQDQFLRCDTGPGDDRILIFASTEQLDILQSTDEFLVDGTFKVVPEIFYQLYIIHGVYPDHVVPLIYALLRRKNAETYQRLINQIIEFAPHWFPRSIMLDFEQASALAFLEPSRVINGFDDLSMDLGDDYQEILDYFEETYIGRLRPNHTRRRPMFCIDFWNMYNRTTQSSMRTNNTAEAYHRRIGSVFQCSHPTLWVFLQKLIDEENATHADILQINAGQP